MSTLVRYPLGRERALASARPWIARLAPLPPPAYPVFVQEATGSSGGASTTIAATFGGAPTAGNLLVFAMAGDKNTGALTLAGWTIETDLLSGSVSLYVAWKVSDGTETTINASWATASAAGNTCWVGEYSQPGADPWALLGAATNITDETTVTTKTTGTTASVAADAIAIALAGVDSSTSVGSVDAWGNSYTTRYSATGFSGRGAVFVAELPTVAGTQSSTFNFTGTADQTSARIGIWARAASAPTGAGQTKQRNAVTATGLKAGTAAATMAQHSTDQTTGLKQATGVGAVAAHNVTQSTGAAGTPSGDGATVQRSATTAATAKQGTGVGSAVARPSVVTAGLKQATGVGATVQRSTDTDTIRKQAAGAGTATPHPVTRATTVAIIGGVGAALAHATTSATGKRSATAGTATFTHTTTSGTGKRSGSGVGLVSTHPATAAAGLHRAIGEGHTLSHVATTNTRGAPYIPMRVAMDSPSTARGTGGTSTSSGQHGNPASTSRGAVT